MGVPPLRWQLLPPLVLPGADNMALDEALARRARETGVAIARVYGWCRPTLSFGRHQRAAGYYDPELAKRREIDVVRRPTGGRAVLHDREITYCVGAPDDAMGALRDAYGAINTILVEALRLLGVDARLADPTVPPPRPTAGACFEEPVDGEIAAGGRKLVGSAQWREDGALLQHGSILIDDDQPITSALLRAPAPPPPPAATLRELLGSAPSLEDFDAALEQAIGRCTSVPAERVAFDHTLQSAVTARRAHYGSDRWTWRR
jgi:lipoate-protein ligase A